MQSKQLIEIVANFLIFLFDYMIIKLSITQQQNTRPNLNSIITMTKQIDSFP